MSGMCLVAKVQFWGLLRSGGKNGVCKTFCLRIHASPTWCPHDSDSSSDSSAFRIIWSKSSTSDSASSMMVWMCWRRSWELLAGRSWEGDELRGGKTPKLLKLEGLIPFMVKEVTEDERQLLDMMWLPFAQVSADKLWGHEWRSPSKLIDEGEILLLPVILRWSLYTDYSRNTPRQNNCGWYNTMTFHDPFDKNGRSFTLVRSLHDRFSFYFLQWTEAHFVRTNSTVWGVTLHRRRSSLSLSQKS